MTQAQIDLHFHWIMRADERRYLIDRNAIASAIGIALGGQPG